MTDFARRILEAPTDADAESVAREAVTAGRSDDVANAALAGLSVRAERARWLAVLPVVADEVSTVSLAATSWLEIARARTSEGTPRAGDGQDESHRRSGSRVEAFDAVARAFAFEPERTETLDAVTSLATFALPHESRNALQWLAGLVRDGVLPRSDSHRFDAAIERAEQAARDGDPLAAALDRVATGTASAEDFTALADADVDYGRLSFDRIEAIRAGLGAQSSHTSDQAIVLSRLYESQGESQLAWVVLAKVSERDGDPRTALALMHALAASGDPDGAAYLVSFVEKAKSTNDRVRFAIHIAGSMHDHGAEEAASEWIARAAASVGQDRAKRLFDIHFALGSKRDTWLANDFVIPE